MLASIQMDVAGPGLVAAAGLGLLGLLVISAMIIVLESLVLWRLKWATFKRALLGAMVANFATTIFGIMIVPFTIQIGFLGLLIDFLLSVLIEAVALMILKPGAQRENWLLALAANGASYLLLILPLYLFFGLLR